MYSITTKVLPSSSLIFRRTRGIGVVVRILTNDEASTPVSQMGSTTVSSLIFLTPPTLDDIPSESSKRLRISASSRWTRRATPKVKSVARRIGFTHSVFQPLVERTYSTQYNVQSVEYDDQHTIHQSAQKRCLVGETNFDALPMASAVFEPALRRVK
jgi:hypothetical protein